MKAHANDSFATRFGETKFEVRKDGVEHCSYCGSVTVAKAIEILKTPGASYSGADWKYGWPHKFYLELPNPDAEKLVEVGSESANGTEPEAYWNCFAHHQSECSCPREPATGYWSKPIMGHHQTIGFKFYNVHLNDATEEELKEFGELSLKYLAIEWGRGEHGIFYKAVPGMQRWGKVPA